MPADSPPISVQLYSFRDEAAKDFAPVLRRLGEMGYVGVEFAGFHDLTPRQYADIVEESGMVTSSAHLTDLSPDGLNATLDNLQEIGCDVAVCAFMPPERFADLDAVRRVRRCVEQGERHRQVARCLTRLPQPLVGVLDGDRRSDGMGRADRAPRPDCVRRGRRLLGDARRCRSAPGPLRPR